MAEEETPPPAQPDPPPVETKPAAPPPPDVDFNTDIREGRGRRETKQLPTSR